MAIETTYFTGTTAETNYAEVLAWLTANAADYFDEITGSENVITCKIGDVNALTLNFTEATNARFATITLKNGISINTVYKWGDNSGKETVVRLNRGIKTDNGISLFGTQYLNFFVAKTSDNNTIFAYFGELNSTSDWGWYIGEIEKSANFIKSRSISSSGWGNYTTYGVYSAGKTALVPAITDVGTYNDNLFFVPFTQFAGQSGITINVDGTKYVYNGVFALKE